MTTHNLLETTRELLRNRPVTVSYKLIAKDIDVSERFLVYLASGKGDHPSVSNVQRLYEYLSGKTLNLG